jgi:hypothetical protein
VELQQASTGQSHEEDEPRETTVLKGHGLSRAAKTGKTAPALAAEGRFFIRKPSLSG